MLNIHKTGITLLLCASATLAQQPPGPPSAPPQPGPHMAAGPRHSGPGGPPGALHAGPPGAWWDNPEMARKIGITSDQKKKMDDAFYQSRLRLIDLRAALEKDQLTLDNLMQGPQLDDSKILPAVDKAAQDRSELEKADARLLLNIRHILTPEQWTALDQAGPRGGAPAGPGGPDRGAMRGRRGGRPGGPPNGPEAPPPPPPGD